MIQIINNKRLLFIFLIYTKIKIIMKNVFLTILGLGFLVMSCSKKETTTQPDTTSDTLMEDTTTTMTPPATMDTATTSQADTTNSAQTDSVRTRR